MDRESIFVLPEDSEFGTFSKDETLPPLPLPKLEETLERYFESLRPFGSPEELVNSRRLINEFLTSDGPKLQRLLEEKAAHTRNWVEQWWEDYAYLTTRTPLLPSCLMGTLLPAEAANWPETPAYFLKSVAVLMRNALELWQIIHLEKLKPNTNPNGTITFSSAMFKRLYNTVRLPGKEIDEIKSFFKTKAEGKPPSHFVVLARGRCFAIEGLNPDGSLVSVQDLYRQLQIVNSEILENPPRPSVALLTHDERSKWAENRQRLQDLSPENRETLRLIETCIYPIALDDREPANYTELVQMTLSGSEATWADKSCSTVHYRNGKVGLMGEHSCYDGSISAMSSFFQVLSIFEQPNIDWEGQERPVKPPREIGFQLDSVLVEEIQRMEKVSKANQTVLALAVHTFQDFGKEFMKVARVHPDSFIQAVLQLTYFRLHNDVASTYETATMREYYHGRTETVRSCDVKMVEMCRGWANPKTSDVAKWRLFCEAAQSQKNLMEAARKGKGVDRHLFGLYCVALENHLPIPSIFTEDPLSVRSGGGGNFVLSTSTLGYTINVGCVAPMVEDGYGVFYTMLRDACWLMVTTFKASTETSPQKFVRTFDAVMAEVRRVFEHSSGSSKL